MPRAKERTPELRRHIVDVALGVLAEEGAPAVTTRRVAELAGTSPPSIYELFGDKAGLVRELFFEGFRRLGEHFDALEGTTDPVADLRATIGAFRSFTHNNPRLFLVMYEQPFEVFEPGPDEWELGTRTREFVIDRIHRCVEAGRISGDPTDIAHALLALAIGLATQETAGWLGSTVASTDRRWASAVDALLQGYAGRGQAAPTIELR